MRVASASIARFGVTFPPFACGGGIAGLGSVSACWGGSESGSSSSRERGIGGVSEQRDTAEEDKIYSTVHGTPRSSLLVRGSWIDVAMD